MFKRKLLCKKYIQRMVRRKVNQIVNLEKSRTLSLTAESLNTQINLDNDVQEISTQSLTVESLNTQTNLDNDVQEISTQSLTAESLNTHTNLDIPDIMKQILLTLNQVTAQQEQQSMMMNEILRVHRVNSNSIDLQKPEELPDMPVKTQEDMLKLNTLLDNVNYRTYMTNRLSAIGGVTVETLTRRILKYVLSNEVAALYNWKGRDKFSFEKTTLKTIIYDAVKKSFPQGEGDDFKIANCIKDWLKFAKLRMASKKK